MMNTILILTIGILDVASIFAVIKVLGKINSKTRVIYTIISTVFLFVLLHIIYFFSSLSIENAGVVNGSRHMMVMSFLPISIFLCALPLGIYIRKYADKEIKIDKVKKVLVIVLIVLAIISIREFFYFRQVQENIVQMQKLK